MSSRFDRIKAPQSRLVQRGTTIEHGGHKVAARAADIDAFNDVVRERKRLNDRLNEQNTGIDEVVRPPLGNSAANPIVFSSPSMSALKANGSEKSQSRSKEEVQVTLKTEHHVQILLGSTSADSVTGATQIKVISTIVSVIQRIVMNQANEKVPNHWLIQLCIEGKPAMDIELEHLGNEEWRLELDKDSRRQGCTNSDTGPDSGENLDQLYADINFKLKEQCPRLHVFISGRKST